MIAIVIPVFNNLFYTKQAILSIETYSNPQHDTHIFIVDNGSTDGTPAYLAKQSFKTITNPSNLGVTKAWNQGLKAALDAGADIICLMNNDIQVGPGWLDVIVDSLNQNPKHFYFPNGSVQPHDFGKSTAHLKGKREPGKCGWGILLNRAAVEAFYPIPEQFQIWYNDDYIYYRLLDLGYTPLVLHDCIVYHFGSKTLQQDMQKYGAQINVDRAAFLAYAKDHLPSAKIRVDMGY